MVGILNEYLDQTNWRPRLHLHHWASKSTHLGYAKTLDYEILDEIPCKRHVVVS